MKPSNNQNYNEGHPPTSNDSTYQPTNIYPSPSVTPRGYNPYKPVDHSSPNQNQSPFPPHPPSQQNHGYGYPPPNNPYQNTSYSTMNYPQQNPSSSMGPPPMSSPQPTGYNQQQQQQHQPSPVYPQPQLPPPSQYPPTQSTPGGTPLPPSNLSVPPTRTASGMNQSIRRWVLLLLMGCLFITVAFVFIIFAAFMSEVSAAFPILCVISTVIFGGILVYTSLRSNNIYNHVITQFRQNDRFVVSPRNYHEVEAASQLPASPAQNPSLNSISSFAQQNSHMEFLQALEFLRKMERPINIIRTFAILHGVFPFALLFLYILGLTSESDSSDVSMSFFVPLLIGVSCQICISAVAYSLFNSLRLRKQPMEDSLKQYNARHALTASQPNVMSANINMNQPSNVSLGVNRSAHDTGSIQDIPPPAGFSNPLV